MKLSRDLALKIAFVIDEFVPPIIRDTKGFMYLPMRFLFGKMAKVFWEFKDKAPYLSEDDYIKLYKQIDPFLIKRATCLNNACITKITNSIKGNTVLEAGCGNGFLAQKIASKNYRVTGTDILVEKDIKKANPKIKFVKANIEHLPFKDKSFDTVICTHTLEHVQNIYHAIKELRRVTKSRLIVIVPKQKPYKFTFDLHLHFFPHIHSLVTIMNFDRNLKRKSVCKNLNGDLYYQEDSPSKTARAK